MKVEICRECEKSVCTSLDVFGVTKRDCRAFNLSCSLSKAKDGRNMECRYVRRCPLAEGGEQ